MSHLSLSLAPILLLFQGTELHPCQVCWQGKWETAWKMVCGDLWTSISWIKSRHITKKEGCLRCLMVPQAPGDLGLAQHLTHTDWQRISRVSDRDLFLHNPQIEPRTLNSQSKCSTTELQPLFLEQRVNRKTAERKWEKFTQKVAELLWRQQELSHSSKASNNSPNNWKRRDTNKTQRKGEKGRRCMVFSD